MATTASRYTPVKTTAQALQDNIGTTTSTKTDSGTSNSNTSSTKNGTSTVNATNMDPGSAAALQLLIQQLMGGGTQQMADDIAGRKGELNQMIAQRAGYSKEAAFGDAQGLMSQQLRKAMETLVPQITRAAEGAGTSANSMRALMLQDAATRGAEASSAAGLNAAVQYGGVSNGMSQIIEALSRPDTTVSNALINALNANKGVVTSSTTNTTETGDSSTSGSTSGTSSSQGTSSTNYTPVGGAAEAKSNPLTYFGPTEGAGLTTYDKAISQQTSNQALQDLVSGMSGGGGFSGYSF